MTEKISDSYRKAMEQVAYSLLLDFNGQIVEANPLFLLNCSLSQLPEDFHIYHFESGQFNKDYYERILVHISQGFTWRDEIRMSYQDNEFWLDMNLALLEDQNKILLLGFDITERKKNEEIIKLQQQQLFTQSQFSALGEMASGIAHEINNPLAIISTSATLVNKTIQGDSEVDRSFISTIMDDVNDTVKRISKIIQGLRNISRDPSKDEFEMAFMEDILEDVLALCGEKFKGHGIDLKISPLTPFKDLPLEILKIQLSQVLLNLLNNSFDAIQNPKTLEEKLWIDVDIQYDEKEDRIEIKVTDSGKGISKEVADKMFNPFYTTKDIGKGTGLGLSLSKAIIRRHNGQFYINHDNPNTQFIINIPRVQNKNQSTQIE